MSTDLIAYAQGDIYDAILIRRVEQFNYDQQKHLAHILIKMQSNERGKFILMANNYDEMHDELKGQLCKIKNTFLAELAESPQTIFRQ